MGSSVYLAAEKAARQEVLASIGRGLREQYAVQPSLSGRLAELVGKIEQPASESQVEPKR